jgi:hypothetical protein
MTIHLVPDSGIHHISVRLQGAPNRRAQIEATPAWTPLPGGRANMPVCVRRSGDDCVFRVNTSCPVMLANSGWADHPLAMDPAEWLSLELADRAPLRCLTRAEAARRGFIDVDLTIRWGARAIGVMLVSATPLPATSGLALIDKQPRLGRWGYAMGSTVDGACLPSQPELIPDPIFYGYDGFSVGAFGDPSSPLAGKLPVDPSGLAADFDATVERPGRSEDLAAALRYRPTLEYMAVLRREARWSALPGAHPGLAHVEPGLQEIMRWAAMIRTLMGRARQLLNPPHAEADRPVHRISDVRVGLTEDWLDDRRAQMISALKLACARGSVWEKSVRWQILNSPPQSDLDSAVFWDIGETGNRVRVVQNGATVTFCGEAGGRDLAWCWAWKVLRALESHGVQAIALLGLIDDQIGVPASLWRRSREAAGLSPELVQLCSDETSRIRSVAEVVVDHIRRHGDGIASGTARGSFHLVEPFRELGHPSPESALLRRIFNALPMVKDNGVRPWVDGTGALWSGDDRLLQVGAAANDLSAIGDEDLSEIREHFANTLDLARKETGTLGMPVIPRGRGWLSGAGALLGMRDILQGVSEADLLGFTDLLQVNPRD